MANIYKSNYTGSQVDDAIGKVVNGKLQEKLTAGDNITISGNTISATVPTIPSITITNGTATTPTSDTVAVISGETASGHTITNTKVNVATQAYVDKKSVAAVQYLGTVSNANELAAKNPDSVGDFCRVAAAFGSYHAGDLLLCKTLKTASAAATWDVIHGELDKDTWTANSKTAAGYVAAGGTNANKVWKTDANGNPAWRDDANTDTNTAHTHTVGNGLSIDGSGGISGNVKYSLKVASSSEIGGVKPGTTSGKTYGVAVASDGAMTVAVPWENNTDSKVTSAANHYTPSADSASQLSVDASSTTAATWNSTSLVTGVNIQRDSKGHVTGVTVDSIKMPANPNSDSNQKVTAKNSNGSTVTFGANDTVEIAGGTNVTVTPDITNKKITIAATNTTYSAGTHIAINNNTISAAWPTASDSGYAGINKTGTITGITMNGTSKGTSGVVDLGTVLTSHQSLANCAKLSEDNIFTGKNKFKNTVEIASPDGSLTYLRILLDFTNGETTPWTRYKYDGLQYSPGGMTTAYDLSYPSKNGVFALISDIPTIVANPANTGSGVEPLTKLQIGTIVYSIPSGGAGGVTSVTTSGTGNAVTGASISGSVLTLTKGSTFLTSHQSLSNCAKLDATNTFSLKQITLDSWQAGKNNAANVVYGSSQIKHTFKSGIISNSYTTNTFSFPNKSGTFALTDDIPSISTCAKLSGGNTFSGIQKFNDKVNILSNDGLYVAGPTQVNTLSITTGKILYPASETNIHEYKLPDIGGTLAIKDDIVEFPGTSKYLGTAYCKLTREATMWLNGQYGSYTCPGYLVAGYGSGSTMSNADIVAIGPGGLYKYPSASGKIKFTLPSTAGTLALTGDIKIKSATLSGTTLTLTI